MNAEQKAEALRLADERKTLLSGYVAPWCDAASALLRTITAEPQGEPVAWIGPYANAWEALNELRKSIAEIIGANQDTWPSHGNAPLAIAACCAIGQTAREQTAPAQTPLTEEQICSYDKIMEVNSHAGLPMRWLIELTRTIEAAHGIVSKG